MPPPKRKSVFKKKAAVKNSASLLSPRLSSLLGESWLLLLAGLALYLTLALVSYSPLDPSWSHSTNDPTIRNFAGSIGAWLSDMLLYVFGYSSWAIVGFCLIEIGWGYYRITRTQLDIEVLSLNNFERISGTILTMLSCTGLEFLINSGSAAGLPLRYGGLLGSFIGTHLQHLIGFVGALMLLGLFGAIAISLLTSWSWLSIMEWLGGLIEDSVIKSWRFITEKLASRSKEAVPTLTTTEPVISTPSPTPVAPSPKRRPTPKNKSLNPAQGSLFAAEGDSTLPGLPLLAEAQFDGTPVTQAELENTSRLIESKLAEFGVEVKIVGAFPGPVITRYEIEPASGVKGAQIVNLMKDLARALSLVSIRVVETIPGKTCMGLELPNVKRQIVRLSEVIGAEVYQHNESLLTIAMGKDIAGEPIIANLAKMPHVLVAGTTGSGKSVAINAMILSLLYKATPQQVRLIMVDPKMLELSVYEGIPHLLAPVVTDMKQAANALNWCVGEMERRYKLMSQLGVRNLAGFNQKIKDAEKAGEKIPNPFSLTPDQPEPLETMPLIVVIIDELADLMMVAGKKIEELIARLAQKARAAGIHLILATQRPSVDVITGLIKANIPTRIAFQVSSKIDSRTILDQMGAESLLGQGDMLYLPPGSGYPQRVHGAFVADEEVHHVVEFLKTTGEANYVEGILTGGTSDDGSGDFSLTPDGDAEQDELYDQAVAIVLKTRRATISSIQRHLRIGYNRAARLIEQMEVAGLVSPMENNGNRTVLAPKQED